jgi:hypothetical protein
MSPAAAREPCRSAAGDITVPQMSDQDIAQMGDVAEVGRPYRGGVLIIIRREASQPLAGRVCVENGEEERFVGWLQLLGILSRVLNADLQPRAPGQGRSELDA